MLKHRKSNLLSRANSSKEKQRKLISPTSVRAPNHGKGKKKGLSPCRLTPIIMTGRDKWLILRTANRPSHDSRFWRSSRMGRWTSVSILLPDERISCAYAASPLGLGRPIKGDALYGDASSGRLMLHAESLTIQHPASLAEITFTSPAEPDNTMKNPAKSLYKQ